MKTLFVEFLVVTFSQSARALETHLLLPRGRWFHLLMSYKLQSREKSTLMLNWMKLFTFVWIMPFVASAAPYKTVAFSLDGGLVQGVPAVNKDLFPAADLITSQNGGTSKYFVIRAGARELITSLVKQGVSIHILAHEEQRYARTIMEGFKLPDLGKKLSEVAKLSASEFKDHSGNFNLKVVDEDISKVLFVSATGVKVMPDQKSSVWEIGRAYYAFPSYGKARQNRRPELASYFPSSEEDFLNERDRLYRIHALLEEEKGIDDFEAWRTAISSLDTPSNTQPLIAAGRDRIAGNYTATSVEWDIAGDGKVRQCAEMNRFPRQFLRTVSKQICIAKYPSHFILTKGADSKFNCQRVTEKNEFIQNEETLSSCFTPSNKVQYLFEDQSQKLCAAYSADLTRIESVASDRCSSNYVITDTRDGKKYVYSTFAGMKDLSETELLARVKQPEPTESELFRLWNPAGDIADDGLDLKTCIRDGQWQTMKQDASRQLMKHCQPDTMYSWGPQQKLDDFLKIMGDGSWNDGLLPRALYMARSPLSTFGYGVISMRIKFKKEVKFEPSNYMSTGDCKSVGSKAYDTVFYRNGGSYSDWVICSSKVIHSWSFDTKEHYDEMIKDYRRLEETQGKSPIGLYDFYASEHVSNKSLFRISIDGHDFSLENLRKVMAGNIARIRAGTGGIFFNPDLSPAEKTPEKHFATDHPIYFNEQ